MKSELKKIEDYFTPMRVRCLNIHSIEQEAGLSMGTLQKFLRRERLLSTNAIDKLIPIIMELGYRPANLNSNIL